ncbi:glucoamylase family protein [Undibacterium sp. TJN25]|uniref:glucoamylase family protein n=1 Tax=Undibacterium sp. TJN25 TaxID=3413056 RepID=UPI003BF31468
MTSSPNLNIPLPHPLLSSLQKDSFDYFLHEANEKNGLICDKTKENWPASIAAVGMALTVYPIGVERGFMSRTHAIKRTLTTLRFLADSEQSTSPTATGYKGFYYHFIDMETGARAWDCELSSIDTALLIAGALTAAAYFQQDTEGETEIRHLADMLYRRIDWKWMLAGAPVLCHGWKPESNFLPWHWEGYDEALVMYVLALASPTHPIEPENYSAWMSTYEWKEVYGIEYLYAGPLFIHQISHLWIDFRNIRDDFMRDHECDYFENSRRATMVQQQYAIRNPMGFEQYGEFCWGVTASDGPGNLSKKIKGVERIFFDYIARGAPYGPDDGTLAPWAVAACLPFAPEIVLPTVEHFHRMRLREVNPYGFKASFSPTFECESMPTHKAGWVSPYHFGINEGPTVIMIDNFENDFIWGLMRKCPYIVHGLRRAGFKGGWLA